MLNLSRYRWVLLGAYQGVLTMAMVSKNLEIFELELLLYEKKLHIPKNQFHVYTDIQSTIFCLLLYYDMFDLLRFGVNLSVLGG